MEAYRLRNPGDEGDGEEGDGSGGEKKGEEGDGDDYGLGAVLDDELQRDGDAAAARGGGSSSNGAGPSGVHGPGAEDAPMAEADDDDEEESVEAMLRKSGAVHTHRQDKVLGGAALRPELEAEAAAQAEAAAGGGAGRGGEGRRGGGVGGGRARRLRLLLRVHDAAPRRDGLRDPMARLLLRLHDDDPDRLEALVDAVNGLPQGGVMVRGELRDADPFAAGAAVAQSGDLANWR